MSELDHPPVPAAATDNNLRGIVLLIASMALFAIEDSFVKLASQTVGSGQIILILGLAGCLVFALISRLRGERVRWQQLWQPMLLLRNAGEVIGTFGFVSALVLVPLSTVSAILQAIPLAVTLGAALFLDETVGWRRWLATGIGFVGVMLIVRPGATGFDPNVLFAVVSVFGLALRDLATRRLPADLPSAAVSSTALFSIILPALVLMELQDGWQPLTLQTTALLGAASLFGTVAYYAIVVAMRIGETSVLAPFRYSRLVFALLIGVLVFHERPDGWMLCGTAIVIITGLYTFHRERTREGL